MLRCWSSTLYFKKINWKIKIKRRTYEAFSSFEFSGNEYGQMLSVQDPSIRSNDPNLPWNEFPAVFQCLYSGTFKSAAARDLHSGDGQTFDVILSKNLSQLFGVIAFRPVLDSRSV